MEIRLAGCGNRRGEYRSRESVSECENPYGHIQIVKTSEDGVVAGLKFQITGNGIDQTVTTGEDGTIKVENLQPGTYTVTELTENR